MLICKRLNSVRYFSFAHNIHNKYFMKCRALHHSSYDLHCLRNQNCFNTSLPLVKQKDLNNNYCYNFVNFKNLSNDCQAHHKCWKCDHILGLKRNESKAILFCDKCHTIQALNDNQNYFELFGISVSFDVDLLHLGKEFKALQMQSHPDKFAEKPKKEHQYSMDNSSLINKAYKTLRDPYERGQYLLDILSDSSIKETDIGIDVEFLDKIMELNEHIEANDASEHNLINILQDIEGSVKNIVNQISIAFRSGDIVKAKQLLAELKFYNSAVLKLKERLKK